MYEIETFLKKIEANYLSHNKKYFSIWDGDKIVKYNLNYKSINGLETMFFPEKKGIVSLVDKFDNGEINKLGLILYGAPGTGKTTLIRAISKRLNRNIVSIKLSEVESYMKLMDLLHNNINESVIIFEDVDADTYIVFRRPNKENESSEDNSEFESYKGYKIIHKDKKNEKDKNDTDKDKSYIFKKKLLLSDVLNVFDGVLPLTNSVIIMTTNHFDKLDPALTRPGRFNKCIELKMLKVQNILEIISFQYKVDINTVETMFSKILRDDIFTTAQLYEYMIESNDIDELHNLIQHQVK